MIKQALTFICFYSLNLYAQVTASFIASDTVGCDYQTIYFTNTSVGATSYMWNLGNGTWSYTEHAIEGYATGTYIVTLYATDDLGNADSMSVAINIYTAPLADFTYSFINSSTVSFNNTSTGATFYEWTFGDFTFSNDTNPTHTYTSSATYNVSLKAEEDHGCVSITDKDISVVITSIKEEQKPYMLKVFPVPSKEDIIIKIGSMIQEPRIEIYDISGKRVKDISEIKGNEVKVSLTGLSKGIYFVKLKDKEGREYSAEKIVIE